MPTEAILAPVPADLLADAVSSGMTRVAFGSNAYEFFHGLTRDHGDERFRVLLYASHDAEASLEIRWEGLLEGWVRAEEAARDPAFEETLRSPLSRFDWSGSFEGGAWALYWIVDELPPLADPIPIGSLRCPTVGASRRRSSHTARPGSANPTRSGDT